MINIQFVFGFIGAAIGLIIGIMVFGQIATAITCPGEIGSVNSLGYPVTAENKDKYVVVKASTTENNGEAVGKFVDTKRTTAPSPSKGQTSEYTMSAEQLNPGSKECSSAKNTAWTVMGILPITLFFVLFSIFGAFGRQE